MPTIDLEAFYEDDTYTNLVAFRIAPVPNDGTVDEAIRVTLNGPDGTLLYSVGILTRNGGYVGLSEGLGNAEFVFPADVTIRNRRRAYLPSIDTMFTSP